MADNLKQRAVSGALWYGGSRFAIQGLTWAVTILVARILTPADYGLLGFALLVSGLADMIAELGLGAAIIQRQDLNDDDLSAVFWFSLGLSLLIYLTVWFSAPFIAAFFKQQTLVPVLRVVMLGFPINTLRIIPWNLLTKRVEFKNRSIIEVVGNIIGALTTLGMAYAGCGVWSLAVGMLTRQAALTLGCQILSPWWPHKRFGLERLRKVIGFGMSVSVGRVMWYLYTNADLLVVGKLLGQQTLGFYSMMFQLVKMPVDRIAAVVNQVAYPVYSQLQDQPERLKRYFLLLNTLISLITFPVFVGMLEIGDVAIPILLTEKWAPLITPLRIMCGVGMIMSVSVLVGPVVLAKGKPNLGLKYQVLCLGVMPVGFVIGSRYGLEGVCWSWAVLYPVLAFIWSAKTRMLIGYSWRELMHAFKPALVSTAGMATAVCLVRFLVVGVASKLVQLAVIIPVGVLAYGAVFYFGFRPVFSEIYTVFRGRSSSAG